MKKTICVLVFMVLFNAIHAQVLPRHLSSEEELCLIENNDFQRPSNSRGLIPPPDMDLRSMAEWEEMEAFAITWTAFPNILSEIVRHGQQESDVIIICTDSNQVKNYLDFRGVPLTERLSFIERPFNSIWIRDYGPNPAYINDVDSLVLVDWIYNRPRFQDDMVSFSIGQQRGVPVYSTDEAPLDLVNTGGNYMSDGMGRGFSSELVLEENGPGNTWGQSNHDEATVDAIMGQFLGLDEYVKMETLPFDLIHHIDMHMKLLDEETLLVGEYPQGVADGPQIEANLQYVLSLVQTPFGNPYDVVRIPMPPDAFGRYPDLNGDYRTYANAFFINRTIIVPTYEEQYDTTALRIWEESMPGYNIVGINCNDIIPLSGALHCITKEFGTRDPLLIQHAKLRDRVNDGEDYTVSAIIKHRDGIQNAYINHRIKGSPSFTRTRMELVDPMNDIWEGQIIAQDDGSVMEYFIESTANNGKFQTRPMTAPEGFWSFKVEGVLSADEPGGKYLDLQKVYPNPASAITCIQLENHTQGRVTINLLDIQGRLVESIHDHVMATGEQKVFFDAGLYTPGMYLIEIKTNEGSVVSKLAIK